MKQSIILAENSILGAAGQRVNLELSSSDVHDPTEIPSYLAGFKNYEDARSVMNGLDKKRSQTLTVRLDGKNRELTLGQAIGLYAHGTDPDTIRLIKSGEQKFAARGAETQALPMSESELLALSAAIDQGSTMSLVP